MSRWYVTDGTTETDLPKQLAPEPDAYLPSPDLTPFRPPGGTTIYYEGDGLPQANWLTLQGGIITRAGGVLLYEELTALKSALATATTLVRDEGDGTLTWALSVGKSHLIDTQPLERLSNIWRGGVRFAVTNATAAVAYFGLTTEDGLDFLSEDGAYLIP